MREWEDGDGLRERTGEFDRIEESERTLTGALLDEVESEGEEEVERERLVSLCRSDRMLPTMSGSCSACRSSSMDSRRDAEAGAVPGSSIAAGEGDRAELELIATHEFEVFAASVPRSVPSCGSGVACGDCRGDSILKAGSKAGRPLTTRLECHQGRRTPHTEH